MRDEFESHLQFVVDENIRRGLTAEQARRAARLEMGSLEAAAETYRDHAGFPVLDVLRQDLRYGMRRIARQPALALLIVVAVGLGIGANYAMLGFVDALVFQTPPHVTQPERLVQLTNAASFPKFANLSEQLQSIRLAAFAYPRTLSLGAGPGAAPIALECVTADYFAMLGVPAAQGRTLLPSDDVSGAQPAIVLSHRFWTKHYQRDAAIVGRSMQIGTRQFGIVGVAADGFRGIGSEAADAWAVVTAAPDPCLPAADILRDDHSGWLTTVGRIADDVTPDHAASELAAVEAGRQPFTTMNGEVIDMRSTVSPLYPSRRPMLEREGRLALWLAAGAGVFLVLACTNIAGLLAMSGIERRRELAIRLQLGASRKRVISQLLTEHLLLCLIGGGIAVLAGFWFREALSGYLTPVSDVAIASGRTLALLLVLTLFTGLASGIFPAFAVTRARVVPRLQVGQLVISDEAPGRQILLAAQVALAVVLLTATGLFVQSLDRFRRDFVYDIDRVIAAAVTLPGQGSDLDARALAAFEALRRTVSRLPEVESAALSAGNIGFGGTSRITFMGATPKLSDEPQELLEVTPKYFATVGLPILRGRAFGSTTAVSEAVINEALAKELFGTRDPIGRCLYIVNRCYEITGVAATFRRGSSQASQPVPQAFVDLARATAPNRPETLLIRTIGPAEEHLAAVAGALQSALPDLPYIEVRPLTELVDIQARSWRLGAAVFSLFGGLALVLAAIGVYGSLAFAVRQRTPEIAVRLALGAERSDVATMVFRQVGLVVFVGCAIGAMSAFAAGRYLESLLFATTVYDPRLLFRSVVIIVTAAAAGTLLPLLRAWRVDPAVALRYE